MDQLIAPETSRLTVSTHVNKFLSKIEEKCKQLNTNGMTRSDQQAMKNQRLGLVWNESVEKPGDENTSKVWRKERARRAYAEIQDVDNHLFLAFVLAIPPTECAKTGFENVLEHLTLLENYKPYHLDLNHAAKKFFESTAAEQGFTGSRRYLSFMKAIFPQNEKPRQIEFAYSLIRLEDIPAFFEAIQQGVYTSQLVEKEETQGVKTSSCVSVFVPSGQNDGSCNIVIDRKVVMEVIHKFQLSDLKL